MSIDKPWKKEFEILLKHMLNTWGGKTTGPGEKSLERMFVYPTYHTTIDDMKCVIDISESATIAWSGAADNIEYLRINLIKPHEMNIQITRETFIERAKKFFHMDSEYQTGNKNFDQRFYIRLKSDKDKTFVSRLDVQELIKRLDPFTIIEFSDIGVRWAQQINSKKQLEFVKVENYVRSVIELAKIV